LRPRSAIILNKSFVITDLFPIALYHTNARIRPGIPAVHSSRTRTVDFRLSQLGNISVCQIYACFSSNAWRSCCLRFAASCFSLCF
jgi:hypothetical protein